MTSNEFYDELSDIFEEPIDPETHFQSCATWSSVTSLSLIMLIEEITGYRPNPTELTGLETAGDLYKFVCGLDSKS